METDAPCIVAMQKMLQDAPEPPLSLAQGIVHWQPPESALKAAQEAVTKPEINSYGADDGNPQLRAILKEKLAKQNGLVINTPFDHLTLKDKLLYTGQLRSDGHNRRESGIHEPGPHFT